MNYLLYIHKPCQPQDLLLSHMIKSTWAILLKNLPISYLYQKLILLQIQPFRTKFIIYHSPVIIVIGPTEFVTVNTIAKLAAVKVVPAKLFKYSAIGDANTLHAYIEPIHKLMKQLAINIIHLFVLNSLLSSSINLLNRIS